MLVVGGGPAGSSAAIYAARKGIRTGVVADRFGGQVMDTLGIENFISVKATEGPKLAAALEEHVKHYDVDIMNLQRAAALEPAGDDGLFTVKLESGAALKSRTVIISTGARWRQMNVPGEKEYSGKGVAYCPHCDGPLFKGKRVAVIGGGNSGVEAAIDLAGIVAHVTLIEFDGKLRADEVLQRKLRSLPNVRVIVSAQTTEVHGADGKVNALSYKDRSSGEIHRVELEGVFVQIGLLPNTDWLKGTVALSPRGEIEVDARGQTSLPGVFAAGDVTTVPYKQIIIAMGEGSKAALSAFDHLIRVPVRGGGRGRGGEAVAVFTTAPGAAADYRSPVNGQFPEHPMEKFSLLFTTDYGLMSLGVILFIIVMGFYLTAKLKKLMNQEPGKEGWESRALCQCPARSSRCDATASTCASRQPITCALKMCQPRQAASPSPAAGTTPPVCRRDDRRPAASPRSRP